jgi:hypothetical protein
MGDGDSWLSASDGNVNNGAVSSKKISNKKADGIIAQSKPISLMGGNKYKLEVKMFHSVHNEERESGNSFVRLFWSSNEMEKQIVDGMFFYTVNKIPPVKISTNITLSNFFFKQ